MLSMVFGTSILAWQLAPSDVVVNVSEMSSFNLEYWLSLRSMLSEKSIYILNLTNDDLHRYTVPRIGVESAEWRVWR